MPYANELLAYIEEQDLAVPDDPDAAVVVGEYVELPGNPRLIVIREAVSSGGSVRVQEKRGSAYVRQRAQLLIRSRSGNDYEATRAFAQRVYDAMNGKVRNTYLSGTWYLGLDADSVPSFVGRDENNRFYFEINIEAFKVPS